MTATHEHREETKQNNRSLLIVVWGLTIGMPIVGMFLAGPVGAVVGVVASVMTNVLGSRATKTIRTIERNTVHS